MQKRSSIFHGILLLTGSGFFFRLVSMLFQGYLSRRVGAAGLGLLQLIGAVGVLAMTLGTSGVRVAAMYLCAEEYGLRRLYGVRAAMRVCIRYGLAVSAVTGAALYLAADTVALRWIGDMRAAPSLRVTGLFLPFNCLCAVMNGYYTACARIRQLVRIEVAERIFSLLITVLLLRTWAGGDLSRACLAVTLGGSVGCVFDFFLLYRSYRRDCAGYGNIPAGLSMSARLLKLCIPLAWNDYLRSGLSTCEQFLIPWGLSRAGSGREHAMASYGAIHGMVFPTMMFPAAILYSVADVLVPELSRSTALHRKARICALTDRCLRLGLVFSVLVSGLLFTLSAPLCNLLYQNETAAVYLRSFAPLVLILYMDAIVDGMHKGLGQQLYCVRYNTITNVMDVVLLYLTLPRYGVAGYFFTYCFTHIVNFYLSIARLMKITDYTLPLPFTLRTLFCGLFGVFCAGLLTTRSDALCLLVRSAAFLATALPAMRALRVLPSQERQWLISQLLPARLRRPSGNFPQP